MLALIARVKNLLLSPGSEWEVIDREEIEPRRLALRYVAPLAAIPALAIVLGLSVVGVQAQGDWHRAPILGVAISALIFFALSIGGVFVFAAIMDWLAPRFGAPRSYRQAFKVSAYSTTAAMVAGLVAIAPALQVFALIAGAYSLYLLFVGTPKVMHPAPASAVNYSIVATASAIVVALIVGLAAMFAASPTGNPFPQLRNIPFLSDIVPDSGQRPSADTPQPSAGKLAPGGGGRPVGGDLRGATPDTLAGLTRVAAGVERSGQPGRRTIKLEAEYQSGPRGLGLQIIYSHAIAQMIGFGGVSTSEYDRETPDGYSRRRRIGDAIVVEDWNAASQAGSYGRLVGDRFYVKATGRGVSPEDLRAAVELFGEETLAQFAAES
jgi:hypothetical protein